MVQAATCLNTQKTRAEDYQPKTFKFDAGNTKKVKVILSRYPKERQSSGVIPLLWLAQKQNNNWLPLVAIEHIAEMLAMPTIKVMEVATFYTMFNLRPVGKYFIQICRTLSCWMRGAAQLTKRCSEKYNIAPGEISADGNFSILEVECLGACANAPVVQINDDYYEDLTPDGLIEVLEAMKNNKTVIPGSYTGRMGSAPVGYEKPVAEGSVKSKAVKTKAVSQAKAVSKAKPKAK